jgi:hypothetical protein
MTISFKSIKLLHKKKRTRNQGLPKFYWDLLGKCFEFITSDKNRLNHFMAGILKTRAWKRKSIKRRIFIEVNETWDFGENPIKK